MAVSGSRHERLALDTSAYANKRRGNAAVLDAVATAKLGFVPSIVLGELEAGFLLGSRCEANSRPLRTSLPSRSWSFSTSLGRSAGQQTPRSTVRSAAPRGNADSDQRINDVWMAAIAAIAADAHLLTSDSDYARIDGLIAHEWHVAGRVVAQRGCCSTS